MFKSRWIWAVYALFIGVRLWAFAVSDNGIDYHHNAFDRPIFVEAWLQRPGAWFPDPAYPPVHFYLLGATRLLTVDLLYAPRLLSLLCALVSFWPLVSMTRRWYGDRAALWAALGYAAFPLGVRVSVVSLEVAPYLMFLALGFERFSEAWEVKHANWPAALFGAFFVGLAAATRFDAWAFLPVLCFAAVWYDRRGGWPVAALLLAFPAIWMFWQWRDLDNPFLFLSISSHFSAGLMNRFSLAERLMAWPKIIFFTLGPPLTLAGLAGFIYAALKKKGWWLLLVFAVNFLLFVTRSVQGTFNVHETKYAAALGLFMLPFAGLALDKLFSAFQLRYRRAMAIVLVGMIAGCGVAQIQIDNQRFQVDPGLRAVASWMAQHRDGRPVIFGSRFQGYLILHGRIPPSAQLVAYTSDKTGLIDEQNLQALFDHPGKKLMVYDVLPDGLDLNPVLKLHPSGEQERFGHRLRPLFTFGDYSIYEVD